MVWPEDNIMIVVFWPEDSIMIALVFPGEAIPMTDCHGMAR